MPVAGAGDDDRAVGEQVVCGDGDLLSGGHGLPGLSGFANFAGSGGQSNWKTFPASQNRPTTAHGYPDTQTSL